MTVQRAIVAFPELESPKQIEAVRRRFDPLATVLPAHVTLVFPFVDSLALSAIREHVADALLGAAPFRITLAPPTSHDGGYLFLRIIEGRRQIVELHDRLYSGPLAGHLSRERIYDPHITVGLLPAPEQLAAAASEARRVLAPPLCGNVRSVDVFETDGDTGQVTLTMPLELSSSAS